MARTVATLPVGSRITDFISLGVIAKTFPVDKVHAILRATGKTSIRQRDLPAHVVVYYVIALALYMHSSYRDVLRCLLEGVAPPVGEGQGRGEVRHLAGPYAAWMGIFASTARRCGSADRRLDDAGRLVQRLAVGQHRRQHARCRRRFGQR